MALAGSGNRRQCARVCSVPYVADRARAAVVSHCCASVPRYSSVFSLYFPFRTKLAVILSLSQYLIDLSVARER